MILSKLSANYLGAISNIHKIFFNTISAPWVLILKGGIWLLFGHLLEVLLKSKIISIQIFYGRIFLSFLNEWILYKCIARIPSTIFGIVIVFLSSASLNSTSKNIFKIPLIFCFAGSIARYSNTVVFDSVIQLTESQPESAVKFSF